MPAPVWWPRRSRLRRLESFLFGTAIRSSSLNGGRAALAHPKIEIGTAFGTEPAAVRTTKWKCFDRKNELFTHRGTHVHVGKRLRQRIDARVVLEIFVGRKHDLDRLLHRLDKFRETAAADRPHSAFEPPMPEEATLPRTLKRPANGQGTLKRYFQPLKKGVRRRKLTGGGYRTMPELANINLKHSP